MTFSQNRIAYSKKCEKIAIKMINLGIIFQTLSKSIMQHGIDEDVRRFIDKKCKQFEGLE
jgi:hypothetical protein